MCLQGQKVKQLSESKYWAPINGLDQAQQQMQGTEYSSWIGGEKSKLMSVGEEVTTLETQEKQKGFHVSDYQNARDAGTA